MTQEEQQQQAASEQAASENSTAASTDDHSTPAKSSAEVPQYKVTSEPNQAEGEHSSKIAESKAQEKLQKSPATSSSIKIASKTASLSKRPPFVASGSSLTSPRRVAVTPSGQQAATFKRPASKQTATKTATTTPVVALKNPLQVAESGAAASGLKRSSSRSSCLSDTSNCSSSLTSNSKSSISACVSARSSSGIMQSAARVEALRKARASHTSSSPSKVLKKPPVWQPAGNSSSRPLSRTNSTLSNASSSSKAATAAPGKLKSTSIVTVNGANTKPTLSSSSSLITQFSVVQSASSKLMSTSNNNQARNVPTLAMSARDKDSQVKLLIRERDEFRSQAELMAKRAAEFEDKFLQSEMEKSHVTSEADDEVVELRRLAQEFEDENGKLAQKLAAKELQYSDLQFKLDELECERGEMERQLREREQDLQDLEKEQRQLLEGAKVPKELSTERAISKAKYEREIELLQEKLQAKDESMIQLRSSLEMKKNELANLQTIAIDLERKLKLESERAERHLKRIDEINLELKNSEAKLGTKSEESDVLDKQVRQLRQDLRSAEEKVEQISLARKKDVDILHQKLSAVRQQQKSSSASGTPTSPQPYKTPTPQDEIVRLQMEIRDLKDQLIDREAELDCNRRDIEVMRRKMETRTLEVDCNNQELARRCQDLLEQNRQSEETVKQLLKASSEHSCQLMHATEDLKEANGKCLKMRDEINELEAKLDEQAHQVMSLGQENSQLREYNQEYEGQVRMLRLQVDSLNNQLRDLCDQLDVQTDCLHKDREALADQLSQKEIESAQLHHDLATARQDLRTQKLATHEVSGERDRLKGELEMRDKYVASRNDLIETLRHELEDSRKSLAEYKQKIEELRQNILSETEKVSRDIRAQLETLRNDYTSKCEQNEKLRAEHERLERQLRELSTKSEEDELQRFDEMRHKHASELDQLKLKIQELEARLLEMEQEKRKLEGDLQERDSQLKEQVDKISLQEKKINEQREISVQSKRPALTTNSSDLGSQGSELISSESSSSSSSSSLINNNNCKNNSSPEDYESQIEFLNSLVVDMQRKCDDYKSRLSQVETASIVSELQQLINAAPDDATSAPQSRYSTITRETSKPVVKKCSFADEISVLERREYEADEEMQSATNTLTRNNNNSQNLREKKMSLPNGRISGRPYCDICNVYDKHHTMFCSKLNEKLTSKYQQEQQQNYEDNNNENVQNNNNHESIIPPERKCHARTHLVSSLDDVDAMFRDYEQSFSLKKVHDYSSLRRSQTLKPSRPYCDHCDLYGHNIKACNTLKMTKMS